MGDTFKFKLSKRKPYCIVKYKRYLHFNSVLKIDFK